MTRLDGTDLGQETWTERNQRLVAAELDRLHARITGADDERGSGDADSSLARLVEIFRLSDFERDLLLWCAGAELDGRFSTPTFAAALAVLDQAHWDALSPAGPLRHWRLVELGAGPALVQRPLHIEERILHHLTGVTCLDSRLEGVTLARPHAPGPLTFRQAGVAAEVAARLAGQCAAPSGRVLALLHGSDAGTRERVAAHVAAAFGRLLLVVPGEVIPSPGADSTLLARLVEREVALLGALPLVTLTEPIRAAAMLVDQLGCPVLVGGVPVLPGVDADIVRVVPSPDAAEQRAMWRAVLNGNAPDVEAVDRIATSFQFEVPDIEAVARELAGHPAERLHVACRVRARTALSELADLVEPRATWQDVVLPEPAMQTLHDISVHVRNRARVYQEWGMAARSERGLGVTALFTGESGTGKTLAAEVLAAELDLDLYRIDLAAVVSKYIGETEKNLKRVFDAADAGGAVLLFDEADAIFGRRSEVRDSHDRYANLEISYLLQRMETYRGLAILTTNLKSALDRSFLRRIRFLVAFAFPDAAARERIWRLMLPPTVPMSDVDWSQLARLQLPGGQIRSIALCAAFLAADAGEKVSMAHLLTATRREYAKLEKTLTDPEIGGWSG